MAAIARTARNCRERGGLVKLETADKEEVKKELGLVSPEQVAAAPAEDPELAKKADEVLAALLSLDGDREASKARSKATVESLGGELQRQAALQSEKLKEPVKKLAHRSQEGGEVAKSLIDLRLQVEELDPARFDFEPGWLTRSLGLIPGIGSPLKRYFSKYESSQTVINAVVQSLELGREQLKRDNITLAEDQKRMRELTLKLERAVRFAMLLDAKLQAKSEAEIPQADPLHRFIQEELLFPLRQRVMDLQQQLAVNQQGVLAAEIIIRNNKELIRGVNRALNVTVNALQVAVTVALALADQRIVLEKVQALSKTTTDLIANTAARLKTQGVEIHKQASQTSLDMEALKKAFADIRDAMDDVAQFRSRALPQMAESIREMDALAGEARKAIEKLETGTKLAPVIPIEFE
ncbi:MAG: toxic anion resistance protein [Elusimicrobia bacterium]|nr:toxic anion resistance protein [Elusimicrobiota bacterium]